MNLSKISDTELLSTMKRLNKEEQERLVIILHHLKEIEKRRLFSILKYSSLLAYTMGELNYTEDMASLRISAMRLLKELPEIEEQIAEGSLSLSNLSQARTLFRAEQKCNGAFSKTEKLEVLKEMEGKSKREATKIVLSYATEPKKIMSEKIKPITEDLSEVQFVASRQLIEKIEKLKGLLAHSNPGISIEELMDKLCDLGIKEWDPGQKQVRKQSLRKAPLPQQTLISDSEPQNFQKRSSVPERVTVRQKSLREHIANPTQREVWRRANSKCEICQSTYALEIDHIIPIGKGGTDALENLRLLCRNCNQRSAIEHYGLKITSLHKRTPDSKFLI